MTVVVQNKSNKYLKNITMHIMFRIIGVSGGEKAKGLIYILLWTSAEKEPFDIMEFETRSFFNRQCPYQNCFLTNDTAYFVNITDFDVILFNAANLVLGKHNNVLPNKRSKDQLYLFFSWEPAQKFPLSPDYDGYFNLTWTYKFDSNATIQYLVIKNKKGAKIGPKKDMHWIESDKMKPTSKSVKKKLRKKRKAAAWFVSNCRAKNQRLEFAYVLTNELVKYNLRLDIYGECGHFECLKHPMEACYELIENDYYFYLAFENSSCEDYVTEKVLYALKHFAVPIVYGGANYTRFLPPGSYLHANELGLHKLAETMSDIIQDRKRYYDFFKWRRYYVYHGTDEYVYTDEICNLCAMLNHAMKLKSNNETIVFNDIVQWWNGDIEVTVPPTTDPRDEDEENTDTSGLASKLLNYYFAD